MPSKQQISDDLPLLRSNGDSTRQDVILQSAWDARKRRLAALMQVLWDSGVVCVSAAAVVFSLSAFFVKLMGHGVPVFEIVAFRSATSFALCFAFARIRGISPLFGQRANLRFLISRGLFGAAAMTTYYFAIKLLPLADAVTLFFLNPAVTAVAAWAIMREPLGLRGVAGVAVSLAGLLLLTRPPFLFGSSGGAAGGTNSTSGGSGSGALHGDGGVGVSAAAAASSGAWDGDRLLGSMFGLLSALLSAGAFISIRHIGKSEPALVVSVYFHVCAAASSVLPLATGLPDRAVAPSARQWGLLAGVAGSSFWGQILLGRGFQLLAAARASAINTTQVVYSYVLGLMFLHESLTLYGMAGSVLIAAGAVLVNLRPKKEAQEGGGAAGGAAAAGAGAPAKESAPAHAAAYVHANGTPGHAASRPDAGRASDSGSSGAGAAAVELSRLGQTAAYEPHDDVRGSVEGEERQQLLGNGVAGLSSRGEPMHVDSAASGAQRWAAGAGERRSPLGCGSAEAAALDRASSGDGAAARPEGLNTSGAGCGCSSLNGSKGAGTACGNGGEGVDVQPVAREGAALPFDPGSANTAPQTAAVAVAMHHGARPALLEVLGHSGLQSGRT